jgi:chalcone isomerase-like protein
MRTLRTLLLAALVAPLLAVPAAAGTLAGVTLPDKIQADGHDLVLNGLGLRKKFVIKVYVGGLYLPSKERSVQKVLAADAPRRMTLHFLYGVSKEQMCDAWEEGLELTTPNPSAEVKKAFQTLCTWMDGVGKGRELTLTYLPGKGTEVAVDGKVKGTTPGKPTADAILRTWLGDNAAPGEDFRNGVMGG